MAYALVSKILEQLASMILQEAEQEVRLVVGVKKEVPKLTSNLLAIQGVLEDAERRQVKDATVRQWLDKLKDVSYDMDDVMDEWNTAILKMKIEGDENATKPKRKVCSFIPPCFIFRQVVTRHDIAIKIKELNERLDVIATEKDRYNFHLTRGIEEPEPRMTASVVDVSRMTASVVNVSEVHGRDQDKKTIVDMLLSESSQGPTHRVISVVGMGGIGKTTLAQLVYNDDMVKAHFQKRIWVCVSDPFDEIRIAKAILEALTGSTPNLNELDSLLQHINHSIVGNKFLLVLDDVWTENSTNWELLKNSLILGSQGSRILVTTRKETVATIMGTQTTDKFSIGQLSKDDCWQLLSQVAFSGRNKEECEKLEDIGRKIADKCKGLPLAAKTLGSLLRFKKTREQWELVLNSNVWKLEEAKKGLYPPLLLSYYELSSTMRRCFSYCAIFPKDYKLEKDKLIYLWIAQGCFKAIENEEMEIIGEECFENLVMRSFFQDFERNEDGNIIRCKMHDIVHDFAQFLTKNECLVIEVNSTQEKRIESSYEKARHLMMTLAEEVSIPFSIYNVKNLRSLIVESRASPSNDLGLPKLFNQLTCLRALEFRWDELKELPREVGKLILLRYLNLSYNRQLEALPEIVCELYNLQYLNVSRCESLKELPHGLGKLLNLRCLEILGIPIKYMPKGVERLTCLRTLDTFYVSSGVNDSEASTLKDLENLNHLRGRLEIRGLGNVRDLDEVKKAQLKNKEHLLGLILNFGREEAEGRMKNDEQVIEAIQPPPNLEQLSIRWYKGTSLFPNCIMSLTNLETVTISDCDNLELLPPLGKLLSLKSLNVMRMACVKKVGIELLGIESDVNKNDKNEGKDDPSTSSLSSVIAFPRLEQLYFDDLPKWDEWDYGMRRRMGEEEEDITTAATITIMPRLHSLTIVDCPKLKALPDHLLHRCPSLERLEISYCRILEQHYYMERKGEGWTKISHIPNIIINWADVQKYGSLLERPE